LDEISSKLHDAASNSTMDDKLSPPPPDALQTMANLRMSQSRPQDALECILKAYDRMRVGCEAMASLVGLAKDDEEIETKQEAQELLEVDAASNLPSYGFRCQTASDEDDVTKKCSESAIQILGSLMAENDEVIEVWYLLGCAFMACSPPQIDSAYYYWDQCMSMLIKVKQDIQECMDDDNENAEGELEAIEEQIGQVKQKLEEIGVKDQIEDGC
jgi:hypothetical protein